MNSTAILVVEDEKIIAKSIEEQLKEMGYALAGSASTGEEAVRKALELDPDLILMDISLGAGLDGIEAASQIRKQKDIPVVYLTSNSDAATLQRAKLTDPFGYVLKPYEDKDLRTAIEIALYRHKMEWRLRENEQWLEATLSSIGDGVIATDEQGRVRLMNPLAVQMTGWSQKDALGLDIQQIFQIVEERHRTPVPNPLLEALAKGTLTDLPMGTMLIDRTGVERPIDDSAAPIRNMNGKMAGAVMVFRDISEHRRLEDHLRQAQKMEAIGRLAGGIAHDFNNIMTIIIGCGELLRSDDQSADQRNVLVNQICDAGNRAAALTQQIMAFSRKQMLVPTVLNLNAIVRDIGDMVKRLIGSNIEAVTDLAPDLAQIRADSTQLGQVILNLVSNARDAMPKGGRLVIATENAVLGDSTIRQYPEVKPGRYVKLTITDTGFGMATEVLSHFFDPFFTTKGVGEGTGLGLATVYGIVKQSGGHIEVSSKVGEGTSFQVYFPSIEAPIPETVAENRMPTPKGLETILLVEDEEGVRSLTKKFLQRSGYVVLEAANGADAIQIAEQHEGSIDLLLTDLIMPHLSGRELAERLVPMKPGLRVLFMSGYTEDTILHQGMESATTNFLQKPFTLATLTAKVREILDGPRAKVNE